MEVKFTTEEMRCDIDTLELALRKVKEAQKIFDRSIKFRKKDEHKK